jgi:anti-anti-sigma factor
MNLAPAELANSVAAQVMLSARLVSELGDPHSTLRATTQRIGPVVIIRAGGEIDAANEHIWRRLIGEAAAVAIPPGAVVVDVSGLDFMGCCAFTVLADEAERCRRRGVDLCLVSPKPRVARTIKACELGALLRVYPTTDSALSPGRGVRKTRDAQPKS